MNNKKLLIIRTIGIILILTIGQFVLLLAISPFIIIIKWKILLLISTLLVLISNSIHFIPKLKEKFSITGLIGIFISLLAIIYLIISETYGQWTTDVHSTMDGRQELQTEFRKEIIWLIAAINFFIALIFLDREILNKKFHRYILFFLMFFYATMIIDFVSQKKPRVCDCDYQTFNDIEDTIYSDDNFDENTKVISACNYKYRFMFIKFGRHCDK